MVENELMDKQLLQKMKTGVVDIAKEDASIKLLIECAMKARMLSYAPYSRYQVGAALLTADGEIVTGCNIENAAYGPSNCAERTAIFKAVSEGKRELRAIAVVGGKEDLSRKQNMGTNDYAFPCGVCRQVMMEFCDPAEFLVIVAKNPADYKIYTLSQLLPEGFGAKNLQ